jgi:hypothetical protein
MDADATKQATGLPEVVRLVGQLDAKGHDRAFTGDLFRRICETLISQQKEIDGFKAQIAMLATPKQGQPPAPASRPGTFGL